MYLFRHKRLLSFEVSFFAGVDVKRFGVTQGFMSRTISGPSETQKSSHS